jgi:NAD(P)-dependent dehydrogenase (short-subunit alcohol dehydrogenase family)
MTDGDAFDAAELKGRVAVITGGAAGIGRAIATELARAGAEIVIADRSGAEHAARTLRDAGAGALGIECNVTSEDDMAEMAAEIATQLGGADILVNNAGIFAGLTPRPLEEIDVDEWRRVMDVNVLGSFLAARSLIPQMRARGGGRIINIGSTSQYKGIANLLHYVASKGAISAMTRSMARELAPANILVNSVAPGFTVSDGVLDHADQVDGMRQSAPGNRLLHRDMVPGDIVGVVRFLSGPMAGFVTGQAIVVDGGGYFH